MSPRMTGQQLCDAASDGDAAKVRTLLSTQGAQSFVSYQNEHGFTPLHFAAGNGHETITKELIVARSNVDLQAKDGCTPLHAAATCGHAAVSKQLIAARCNVDLQSKNGTTPLHGAAIYGHVSIHHFNYHLKENNHDYTNRLCAAHM